MQDYRYIKAILLAASSMTVMAGAIISPALPDINAHYSDQSEVLIKLILTMPALMITLFGAPMGFLADRFGRKRLLTSAMLLYGIAGFAGYIIDNFILLIISRAVLGVAVAGIMSVSTTLIGDYFEADERTRFLGTQGSFMAMGGIVFLNLGGVLAEWSWRGPFLVYLLGLFMAPLAWKVLFEPNHAENAAKNPHPENVKVDRVKTGIAYSMGLLGMMLFYMVPAQLPFLLNSRDSASSMMIGMVISIATFTSAMVSFNYGRIKKYLSVISIYLVAHLIIGLGYITIGLGDSMLFTAIGVGISGLGFGFMIPNGNVWLMMITPLAARGRIIGGFSSMIFLGQFVSPLVVDPLSFYLDSLQTVFILAGIFSVLLGLGMLLLDNSKQKEITLGRK